MKSAKSDLKVATGDLRLAAQAAARIMIDDGRAGSIITISSQMAVVGGVDRAVYCGSKHAVEGFTKAMAVEFGKHGLRINTICPTFIRTPLTEQTFARPERVQWIEEKINWGVSVKLRTLWVPCSFWRLMPRLL